MSDIASSLALIDAFEVSGPAFVRWHLDRREVVRRLRQLVRVPDLLNQRGLNACAPAAFFRTWFARDPESAVTFTLDLLVNGHASIGSLFIQPGSGLLGQDYARLRATTDAAHPNATPESTDWMLLSALRDSENAFVHYLGEPYTATDALAGLTMPSTLAGWLNATNLYSSVANQTNLVVSSDLGPLLSMIPTSNVDILLFINARAVYDLEVQEPGTQAPPEISFSIPDHFVAMTAPFAQADTTNWLKVDVWTWGGITSGWQRTPRWTNNYFGTIVATV